MFSSTIGCFARLPRKSGRLQVHEQKLQDRVSDQRANLVCLKLQFAALSPGHSVLQGFLETLQQLQTHLGSLIIETCSGKKCFFFLRRYPLEI